MAKDPYRYFRIEARELVEGLSKGALELEHGDAKAGVARLLRLAHSLKGAARVVRCNGIAELSHQIEEQLEPHRGGGQPVPTPCVAELLRLIDGIRAQLPGLELASGTVAAAVSVEETDQQLRLELGDLESLIAGVQQVSAQIAALSRVVDGHDEARRILRTLGSADSGGTDRLSSVLDRTAEAFLTGADRARRDIERVRSGLVRLRLVEANAMAGPLEAASRDAARALGKEVRVVLDGGATRLDAHVIAGLREALLHAVRNAVVHGIESPAQRAAAGKSPTGTVIIRFERIGHRVQVTCADDGCGIDPQAIRQAAMRKGLLSGDAAAPLDHEVALRLILEQGVSTTSNVTELSGRGVGMDVVRDVARRLKGSVSLSSKPERGTTLTILAPVSLFSIPAVVVRAGNTSVAIPRDAVTRVERLNASRIVRSSVGVCFMLDGAPVPFLPLATVLRRGSTGAFDQQEGAVLVVAVDGSTVAVGVDRVVGTEELLLSPLPSTVPHMPMIAGVAFDAEGDPELVFDPAGLVEAVQRGGPLDREPPQPSRLPVLVVDDSLTTRMLESAILESAGYDVELATSGEEGLAFAGRRRHSIYIVDVEMPGMDGFEFVSRIRANPELHDVPAIMVSSLGSQAHRRRGDEVGAQAYIVKSEFEQERFLAIIAELTGSVDPRQ